MNVTVERACPRPLIVVAGAVVLGAVACGEVTPPDGSPAERNFGPVDPAPALDSTLVVDTAYVAAGISEALIGAIVVDHTIVMNGVSVGTLLPPGGPVGPTGGTGVTEPGTPGPGIGEPGGPGGAA